MKKIILTSISAICFCIAPPLLWERDGVRCQTVFWTETFSNSCASACLITTYTAGPNGAWTQTSTGTNDPESNKWYVSCSESGNAAGQCGSGCTTIQDPSLHIGANDGFSPTDPGASYNAGGLCPTLACVAANMRAESPVINCSGQSTITLSFNYIENGDGTNDDASLWYYDGITWALFNPLNKPSLGTCAPQGQWTAFGSALPASANNNPNVKIGFNWTNNDDGVGTDPSFAVDDITLSSSTTGIHEYSQFPLEIIPTESGFIIQSPENYKVIGISDLAGRRVNFSLQGNKIFLKEAKGIYFIDIEVKEKTVVKKVSVY